MRSSPLVVALSLVASISLGACGVGSSPSPGAPPGPPAPPPVSAQPAPPSQQPEAQPEQQAAANRVRVTVRATGYDPATINAPANQPITIVFNRVDDGGCGGEVVFPAHNIRRTLPAGQDVEVTLTPRAAEQIQFTCGMAMLHGTIVASR